MLTNLHIAFLNNKNYALKYQNYNKTKYKSADSYKYKSAPPSKYFKTIYLPFAKNTVFTWQSYYLAEHL